MTEMRFDSGKDIDPESLALRFARYLNGLAGDGGNPESNQNFFNIFLATTVPFLGLDEEIISTYQPEIERVTALLMESKVKEASIALTGFATSMFQYYSQEDLKGLEALLNQYDDNDYGDDYLSKNSINN